MRNSLIRRCNIISEAPRASLNVNVMNSQQWLVVTKNPIVLAIAPLKAKEFISFITNLRGKVNLSLVIGL